MNIFFSIKSVNRPTTDNKLERIIVYLHLFCQGFLVDRRSFSSAPLKIQKKSDLNAFNFYLKKFKSRKGVNGASCVNIISYANLKGGEIL